MAIQGVSIKFEMQKCSNKVTFSLQETCKEHNIVHKGFYFKTIIRFHINLIAQIRVVAFGLVIYGG